MTKLKLIKKITSDWFDSHAFVNEVYWGDFIRWYADKEIQHSSVVITPIRVTEVTRSKRAIQLQITYADRVFGDFRNLDDVHSDADRVLADFILSASNDKEIRKYLTGLTSGNIEYFTNRTGDLVAGATMSVNINVFSDANNCEIPVDFKPQPTPFVCADASYTVEYENGTLIEQGTIPSGGSVTVEVPDIPTCDVATWELRDTDNNLLDSGSIASGGSATITAPDATVNIQKSDSTLIASVTAPSGGVEPYNVADSVITVNGDTYTDLKATDSLNIPIVDSNGDAVNTTVVGSDVQVDDLPCTPSGTGAELMKTGQTTSFRTGDDGDLQAGRDVDFFTLPSNNPFDNNKRFTGVTGGYYDESLSGFYDVDGVATTYALAFPDNIMIDWSTYDGTKFLMYHIENYLLENVNNLISACTSANFGGFSTWRLWNIREALNLLNFDSTSPYNYEPLLSGSSGTIDFFVTSTGINSTENFQLRPIQGTNSYIGSVSAGNSRRCYPVRTTNISELNL